MCDIIARVESSWKKWRKNSLQLDLEPISFTSHSQYIHGNVENRVGFQLMVLFQM